MEKHEHNTQPGEVRYMCPMECEGDKTYKKEGTCPVCGMFLAPSDQADKLKAGQKKPVFYCPMKCEGEKVYDAPGRCPVCNMFLVNEETVKAKQGADMYAESRGHHSPAPPQTLAPVNKTSLSPVNKTKTTNAGGDVYYCPMLCEGDKTYDRPGDCPVCGMHLIKKEAFGHSTADSGSEEDTAYREMLRKFWIAVALAIPVFILSMGEMVPFMEPFIMRHKGIISWISFVLTTPVVFYSGWQFFKRGYSSVVRKSPNMWTLISIGVGAAYIFSVLGLIIPGIFPAQFRDMHGNVHLYFEAAAVILALVLLGQVLELRAHSRTSLAIKSLLNLVPPVARVIRNGQEIEIPLNQVMVGDILRVKPGDKIAVDGEVIEGEGTIDESMITGESIPIDKVPGDKVTGGTINGNTSFTFRALKVGSDTLLARIIEMVNEASLSRAPIQRLADKVAKYFVQIIIVVAILTFAIWAIWGPEPSLVYAFVNAVSVLIIACPCALGLATPMSVMVGTARGAQSGILIKDARAIEEMNKINTLIIDKTGTITEGKPALQSFKSLGKLTDEEVLQIAASVDSPSEHPLAAAIVKGAKERNISLLKVDKFRAVTGKGVEAYINDKKTALGNDKMLRDYKAVVDEHNEKMIREWQMKGQTVMYLLTENRLEGIISVADQVKATSREAIHDLKQMGVKVIMLTGDNEYTARAVAQEMDLDEYKAECLPDEKYAKVKELQEQGLMVAMAGDGINDAPALAQANIGIAMGTGTEIAMQSAEITLVKGDLKGIARAKKLSSQVMSNIKQNLFFAFIYNILGVPIAAGILFPFFGILLSPMIAAVAMSFSSVSVISNALRLRTKQL